MSLLHRNELVSPLQFTFGSHPQVMFTWGSSFPDRVKVQKRIQIWPLRFKLRFEYNSFARTTSLAYSCKVSSTPFQDHQWLLIAQVAAFLLTLLPLEAIFLSSQFSG